MQSFLRGFFRSRQNKTRFGRSGGGFPRRTGRFGTAALEAACAAFSPAPGSGVVGVFCIAFGTSDIWADQIS